ncbi:hypothetical protein V8F06_014538 [Rhypophila decipiens]
MASLDFDLSQWYNEDNLDYRTPELTYGDRSASFTPQDQPQRRRPGLPLLQLADWNPSLPYDESPPTCIHYSIEWKMLLKKGRLSKLTNDTEQNLVLAPGAFWDQTLKPKLLQLLAKKTPRNKSLQSHAVHWGWRDPENRKHYKLDTSVLTKLVDYAEEGNILRTHGDVPPWIRELIYAKEQQDSEHRKRKRQGSFSESLPPIHITNVIPARYNQDSVGWSNGSPETRDDARIWHTAKLDIPPPIDQSLHRYWDWLCARVADPVWKDGYRDACKIAVEDGLDLERLYYAQDVEARTLTEKGVKRGIAIQFVSKVKAWLDEV